MSKLTVAEALTLTDTPAEAAHLMIIKRRTAKTMASKDSATVPVRCTVDPKGVDHLTAKHKISPVAGSLIKGIPESEDNKLVSDTGKCPLCGTQAKVGAKGFIGAHNVLNGTVPASPALTEHNMLPTDTGSHVGDPESGNQRRVVEIDGAFGRGVVEIPVKGDDDKTKMIKVPATLENLRACLAYWVERKPRKQESKDAQTAMVLRLNRQIKAAIAGPEALTAAQSPEGLPSKTPGKTYGKVTSQAMPGAALVKGRSTPTMASPVNEIVPDADVDTRTGYEASAGTMAGPTGRERPDKTITEIPMAGEEFGFKTYDEVGRMSRSQRSKYWAKVSRAKRDNAPYKPLRERHDMPGRHTPVTDTVRAEAWQRAFGKS